MNASSKPASSSATGCSRRAFLKTGTALAALPLLGALPSVHAAGTDRIRIGLVGCGSRGLGAVRNCLRADPAVQLHALGDLFPDCVDAAVKEFREGGADSAGVRPPLPADRWAVPRERCFAGFDACQAVIASGVDLVLLATPPQFRPLHLEAAVKAGIHVFAEKPVAVDPVGCRRVAALAALVDQKRISVLAGTHRRHSATYIETMKRVHDGAIGDLVSGQCYFVGDELWHRGRRPEWSDMEHQIRNWLYFTWLSGDIIVEQGIHSIDVMNWAFGGAPVKAFGLGGRQNRTDPKYGNVWDHFSVELEYAGGARVQGMFRQARGTSQRTTERIVGTRGVADPVTGVIVGEKPWKYAGEIKVNGRDGQDLEHVDLIRSLRSGQPINHCRRIADSTLTAILGRVSAYTGREVNFSWLQGASKLDLTPPAYAFGPAPAAEIAIPGRTPLV